MSAAAAAAPAPAVVRRTRPAMGTWFEAVLVGDDPEHLDALACAALDEVERVERRLSRFDPRGEVARVNREAGRRAVLVDYEVLGVLLACRAAWEETGGAFDVTATSGGSFDAVSIDPVSRSVRFTRPGLALDLGGFGKGYALDRAAEILRAHGARSAFLHGGTSSALALGNDGAGNPWRVGVRDPFADGPPAELFAVALRDRALSCSATLGPGRAVSDLIDPRDGSPLAGHLACAATASTAARAEVLSTAALCLGRHAADDFLTRSPSVDRAAWLERDGGRTIWEWFGGDCEVGCAREPG